MIKSFFILGTDTNCGKTYVTVELIKFLRNQDLQVRAIKPVASGCHEDKGSWVNDDIQRLQQANGNHSAPIYQYMLQSPIAPHLAAKAANLSISVANIKAFYETYPKQGLEYLLIEGAGGLYVPLNNQETWVDFLLQTHIPVILVVGMRLGCINHSLLTAFALRKQSIRCHGWIANFIEPSMLAQEDNLSTLQQWLDCPLLGTIAFQGSFIPHTLLD